MNHSVITTNQLTRAFGELRAVDQLSLEVPHGIVFGFLGPNGSGKTTTIRLLLGLLEPSEGRASVLGFDTRTQADSIRERCGALLEHTGLYERLTAEDNLDYFGRIARMPAAARAARSQELLKGIDLWDRRGEIVGRWSRGMKQKLAVARALLHRPQLVFLDEPTAGLDPGAAAALRDDLQKLVAREGATVFLTTHNLAEAEKLCARVAVIRKGKLLAEGRPEDIRAQAGKGSPRVEVYGRELGDAIVALLQARPEVIAVNRHNTHLEIEVRDDTDTAPLVGAIVSAGGQVEEVRRGKASLEEAFLELVEE